MLPAYINAPKPAYHGFLKTIPLGSELLGIGAGMIEKTQCSLDGNFDVHSKGIYKTSSGYLKYRFAKYNSFKLKLLISSNCHLITIHLTSFAMRAA